jgi:anti-anti-sigma factor
MPDATIDHQDLDDHVRRILLSGRLDMVGMESISLKFTSLSAIQPLGVIVDLQAVTFLASIGIRSLISSARALDRKGGRMVLLVGDNDAVRATLEATGIDAVIPLHRNEADAVAVLRA